MRKILLFGEDDAHERVGKTLLNRLSADYNVPVEISVRSSIGGYGRAVAEFDKLLKDIAVGREFLPSLVVIATDSNCIGLNERLKQINKVVPENMSEFIAYMIPSPHIERWLLLDSEAFKKVLGRGCQAPDFKCQRDRYKNLLANAVRETGVRPLLGGLEYSNEIIEKIDIDHCMRADKSFERALKELRRIFTVWQGS